MVVLSPHFLVRSNLVHMKKTLLFCMALSFTNIISAQVVIPLYEGEVPNSKPFNREEQFVTGADGGSRVSKVSKPTLTAFFPPKDKANGTSVIICPGGGYVRLSIDKEGYDVAKVLNEWGVTAFVLKSRLPDDTIMIQKEIGPLQDAQRAIQLVRSRAAEWKLDTKKVGIMGFSAGGHLASMLGTHYKDAVITNTPSVSLRPDFMILLYPVISFMDSLVHSGSRASLLGHNASHEKLTYFSTDLHVNAATPETFLVHAKDDKGVNFNNSVHFYNALQKHGVRSEIHLFEKGGHGFGLNNTSTTDKWTDWLKVWMQPYLK